MPVNEHPDLAKYKKIIVCSPVWVFGVCAPIRCFFEDNYKNLDNIDLVLVHFNKIKYSYIYKNIEKNIIL